MKTYAETELSGIYSRSKELVSKAASTYKTILWLDGRWLVPTYTLNARSGYYYNPQNDYFETAREAVDFAKASGHGYVLEGDFYRPL